MITYDVIEILTENVVLSDKTQEECIEWIGKYGNIVEYTILQHQR